MVQLKLSEIIIDAAIAKLQDGMADRVAQINAEKDDGIVCVAPGRDDYYPFGVVALPRAPAIVVTELDSPEYEPEGSHSFMFAAEIAVVVYEQDSIREQLGRRLLRQSRAVVETLWDNAPKEALSNSAFILQPVRHVPGPVMEPDAEGPFWRQMYVVVFRARQLEG